MSSAKLKLLIIRLSNTEPGALFHEKYQRFNKILCISLGTVNITRTDYIMAI